MAVSLVGTGTFITSTNNGVSLTLTISTGAAAAGDIAIAVWAQPRLLKGTPVFSSDGTAYTAILASSCTTGNTEMSAYYRILTGAETTVRSCATGSAQDAVCLAAIVLRGIDPAPSISSSLARGTSSFPDSPQIMLDGPNDAVISCVAGGAIAAPTAPGSLLNPVSTAYADTRNNYLGLAWYSTNAGNYDPANWTSAAAVPWIAFSITVRSTETAAMTWLQMACYPDMVNAPMPMIGY